MSGIWWEGRDAVIGGVGTKRRRGVEEGREGSERRQEQGGQRQVHMLLNQS